MNIYSAISANKWKTWVIIALFIIFITTLSYVFGKGLGYDWSFVGFAFIFAGISSLGSYFYADKLVLATVHAKQIQKKDNPLLFTIVENLCIGSGQQMPKIYIMNEAAPNAFATGRDPQHAVVCVTTGILELLNKAELEGVIAHELSHINNYDTRLLAIVAILVGFVAILADMFMNNLWWGGFRGGDNDDKESNNLRMIFLIIGIVFAILSPLIATLIQLAVSRKREFLADASGVLLTRYPQALANALEKIAQDPRPIRNASNATAHLFIASPFKDKTTKQLFASLFETHPPIEERIKVLREM